MDAQGKLHTQDTQPKAIPLEVRKRVYETGDYSEIPEPNMAMLEAGADRSKLGVSRWRASGSGA